MSKPFKPGDKIKCIADFLGNINVGKTFLVREYKATLFFATDDNEFVGGNSYKRSIIDGNWLVNNTKLHSHFVLCEPKNHLPRWF